MRCGPLLLASVLLAATGCTPLTTRPGRPGGQPAAAAAASPEAASLDRHIAALETQIAKLEHDLGKGRGVYRDGSLLRVEGRGGGEAPLDRLRRLERELADAEARIATRDQRVVELTRELAAAREQGRTLSEQAGDLSYSRDALVTAQQALAEARGTADGLKAQLSASELQRLKAEREYYRFAAKLLKLSAGQTSQLMDLQDEARETARNIEGRGDDRPVLKLAIPAASHQADPAGEHH
jgi:chromosome segregation ATPase